MFDVSTEEITEGSLTRALVLLAVPLFVQNLVQVFQEVVDLVWLGRLGGDAVAAVGLVLPPFGVLVATAVLLPFVGTQIVVSQRVGADDPTGARRLVRTGVAVAAVLGGVLGAAGFLVAPALVDLTAAIEPSGGGGGVGRLAADYLEVVALGIGFAGTTGVVQGAFLGWGDSRTALVISVVRVTVNVVLDPVLIFGAGPVPGLGVRGAALATVTAGAVGLFVAGWIGVRRDPRLLRHARPLVSRSDVRELVAVGLPTAGQSLARQLVRLVVVAVVLGLGGTVGLTAYVVGTRVATIVSIPAQGLQQAAQSVVGQNVGADRFDRADRTTWLGVGIVVALLGAAGVVQWLFPVTVATLFAPALDGRGLALATEFLRLLALGYPALGAFFLFRAGFNGARRTRTSMVASMLQYWGVRLPAILIGGAVLGYGMAAVFWAVVASDVLAAVGTGVYYRHATRTGMFRRAADRQAETG